MIDKEKLLQDLIAVIGQGIEKIGDDLQTHGFVGMAIKLEQLRKLIKSAEAVEEMRRI